MDIKIPEPLKVEHEELHAELVALTKAPGEVGEAARGVATLLHPHFVKEEEYALPPLGLLVAVAQGRVAPDMREVLAMTERLQIREKLTDGIQQLAADREYAIKPVNIVVPTLQVGK